MGLPYAEVIGDPIAHSKSPVIHRHWLGALRMAGDYRAVRIGPDALGAYLDSRRADPDWKGCSVTRPLKEQILGLLESIAPGAAAVGAVNLVTRDPGGALRGRNSDVPGIVRSLEGLVPADARIVIVGAGGAARAAAEAVKGLQPAKLIILCRRSEQGRKLLDDLGLDGRVDPLDPVPEADLLINASPRTGPWDLSSLDSDATVFDMVYEPLETLLLQAARARGMTIVDGLTLLAHQAEMAFSRLFGADPPPPDAVLRARLLA